MLGPAVDLGVGVTAVEIVAGEGHSCALLSDQRVKCWGSGINGEIGLGDTNSRGDGPGEMGDSLPAIDLGTGLTAVTVSATWLATCAVLSDGRLKCWGSNQYGAMGLGDTTACGDQPGEMGDALPAVKLFSDSL